LPPARASAWSSDFRGVFNLRLKNPPKLPEQFFQAVRLEWKFQMKKIHAKSDAALNAVIIKSTRLFYQEGPSRSLDRPPHVRAGSGLARLGRYLTMVQDDANFVALMDLETGQIKSIALPAGEGGARQFDDVRGNKKYKMDLESCALVSDENEERLIAFGSGASRFREQIIMLKDLTGEARIEICRASSLYARLRDTIDFSGSEMNIEGAVFLGEKIRLFNRGNGAARPGGALVPVNSSCDLDWFSLDRYLTDPDTKEPPAPQNILQYDLGEVGGLALGFTDAAQNRDGKLFFSAAAEDSPDALNDGSVSGSVIGVFDSFGNARWTILQDINGKDFPGKVEGLTFSENDPNRAFIIIDEDQPTVPAILCEVELSGSW
jgi:hypothetical protein